MEKEMTGPEEVAENIWTFAIELPRNPLKSLNCYVVKDPDGGRELLVDTGFFFPECTQTLMRGIEQLGLRPENTDVFLTHIHSDHVGNAAYLEKQGFRIVMGALDYDLLCAEADARWGDSLDMLCREGMPKAVLEALSTRTTAVPATSGSFSARKVYNGDVLRYGKYSFECVFTPGHSPGHTCLFDEKKKTILLGDHVLFDITPNICAWTCMEDALGMYLNSLRRVRDMDIDVPLPAHRAVGNVTLRERIDELFEHHEQRLNEALEIVRAEPGLSAYEIAARMRWHIRADSWDDFPVNQKYFAHGETVAHLDRLAVLGQVIKKPGNDGVNRYYAVN